MKNKKYIILDLGRVCLNIDPNAFFLELNEAIAPEDSLFWQQQRELECGRLSEGDFFIFAGDFFKQRHSETKLKEAYCSIIQDEIPGMAEWFEEKKSQGFSFIMLSDTSDIHIESTKTKLSYFDEFEARVFSYEVGACKPDKAMYLAVEEICGGKPVAFVDDKQINIDGAQAQGWSAILFSTAQQLFDDFEDIALK